MRKRKICSFICFFTLLTGAVSSYVSQPDTFILYKDRSTKIEGIGEILVSDTSIEASKDAVVPRKAGDYEASLSIFGIPYKSVTLKVLDDAKVIPGGQAIGIRLYSDSLVVIAVGRVNENKKSPAEEAGIKSGDVITHLNGEKVGTPDDFTEKIAMSEGEIVLEIKNEETTRSVTLLPEVSQYDNVKRIGLWVRDSTAGVGTLTYVDKNSMTYGALGHGVSDSDTGVKFSIREGSIEKCGISSIKKGEKGDPGELKGMFFANAESLGDIVKNEKEGIFGNIMALPSGEEVSLGHKSEIVKGRAYIRTSLGEESTQDYEIEILKVSKNSKNPAKGLVIKVTDERLLEKTGGIVQGMSGSPILQNGKLIGAVTHVLVNDPTKGYGIFIENMIEATA